MSPLIDIQRRMAEVGRIRAGDKTDAGHPRKLANWRLTSKDKTRLEHAQEMWGGKLDEWDDQWQLYTETAVLPIMLIPGHPPTSWYELWSKGGCQRRCDGHHELISDSACLCDDERECKPTTRLSVLLPDIPGIGSWMLSSTGWNAAAELAGSADLLSRAAVQGILIPARLRLEQRTSVKAGQTRKFAVPVIDIDVSIRQLLGGELAAAPVAHLPAGYTPIVEREGNGTTLAEGLEIAHTQQITSKRKGVTPNPDIDDEIEFGRPAGDMQTAATELQQAHMAAVDAERQDETPVEPSPDKATGNITEAQRKKLNTLVGTLRDSGHLRTAHLYAAVAQRRKLDTDVMAELIGGVDLEGELHWAPLRDTLHRDEASDLIDRLTRLETNVNNEGEKL